MTKEASVAGRIFNPKPMNPLSMVWPAHNPNIITIERGAFSGSQRKKLDPSADNRFAYDKGKKL